MKALNWSALNFRSHIYLMMVISFLGINTIHAAPPLIGILINNGEKFTNNKEITVRIRSLKNSPDLVESMQIGLKSDLSDASWQSFSSEPVTLHLTGEDGEKHVYARLRDKAGNPSEIESAMVILDTTPPQSMEFFINKGAEYTNDNTGRVFLQYKGEDAVAWQVSNTNSFGNTWEALTDNMVWNLDMRIGDGEKTVFVRFKDQAGNAGEALSKKIIVDTKPPSNGSIVINDNDKYLKNLNAKLKIKVEGADVVRIVDRNGGENFDYKPGEDGSMNVDWQFDSLQGVKLVKAFFMDAAKNKTTTAVEDEIIYDTKPPHMPRLVINNGSKFTNAGDGAIDLQIYIRDNEPGLTMSVSNSKDFSNHKNQDYNQLVKSWKLDTSEDGLKTIYVRLIDEAGNVSEAAYNSIVLDRTAPTVKSVLLNEGSKYVTTPRVNILMEVDDASMMQISNNPNYTSTSAWEKYENQKFDWRLIPGDGEKTVYVRFRDEAGNISEIISSKILLDTEPPVGKLTVNEGKKYTNDPQRMVSLKIEYDGKDTKGMQISNTPDFSQVSLQPIETSVNNWQLSEGEGTKTVFLRLKDEAGNYSSIYTANVILDQTPPENCSVVINNDDEWLLNITKRVALSLTATDAFKMKVSNTPDFSGVDWLPYKTAIGWTLEGDQGEHHIYAIFADQAGNVSEPVSDMIKSDFSPPVVNAFTINEGAKFTNNSQKQVSLNIDVEGATKMAISNSPITESTPWEDVQEKKEWVLSNEDGIKTVYARFKDIAGNVSSEVYSKIMLDRVPPTNCEIAINKGEEWMTNREGKVKLFVMAEGASEMMLSQSEDFANASWEKYNPIKDNWTVNTKERETSVFAKFKDEAGNVSGVVSSSIKVDITPPQNAKIVINKGDKFLTNEEKKLSIGISVEGAEMMRISTDERFRDAQWEPVGGLKEIIMLEGDGKKTIYAQFKDQAENLSEAVSDEIILDTTPPEIKSFAIDNGAEWTNNDEKKVTLTIQAEGATEMRVDHDPAFSNSSWQKFSTKIENFVLQGEDGEKTLFLTLKDEAGNISQPVSAKINLKRSF